MATAELLARLNARVNSLEGMPPGGGPALTEHDISAALGMSKLPEGARYLLRIKWAHQYEFVYDLARCLYMGCMDRINYRDYTRLKSHRPKLIRDLSQMAVVEYCHIAVCGRCKGRKQLPTLKGKYIPCPSCKGFGITPIGRGSLIDEYLGIPHSTFYHSWDDLLKEMLILLGHWEGVGISAVARRMG